MKKVLLSKQAKIIVDILLILGPILSMKHDTEISDGLYWKSSHCIICILWFLMTVIHVCQHWKLIKAFTKRKVIAKNKITALTILCFILMTISVLLLMIGNDISFLRYHNLIGHLYFLVVIIHVIQKFKRFLSFFAKKNRN